jgi:hypothetical protein
VSTVASCAIVRPIAQPFQGVEFFGNVEPP